MPCRVAPLPDGTVRVFFRPEKAGPCSLSVTLEGANGAANGATNGEAAHAPHLNATVTCNPGPVNISTSGIVRKDTEILAGRTGSVVVSCCDVFGNPTALIPVVPVTLTTSGKLRAWWSRAPRSSQLVISFSSEAAGQCSLSIAAPEGGAALQGSPLAVTVKPDAPCAARCLAQPRSGTRALTSETASLVAGAPACCSLRVVDAEQHGPTTPVGLLLQARSSSWTLRSRTWTATAFRATSLAPTQMSA